MSQLDATTPLGPFAIGALVAGRYRVDALLGAGAMGTVYRAYDGELDELVALKVLRAEASVTEDALRRFKREVKLARRVLHPNVARAYDLGVAGDLRFLTMELIGGSSLGERMRAPLALPEALRLTSEVARGLAAAHAVGVVHRDLKPDNVMLDGERVVITDFGIARPSSGAESALATSGAIVGTPAYMAPEQLESGAIDGRADVYALGVMLFELVTGGLPFDGSSPIAIATARVLGSAPRLEVRCEGVPPRLADLVAAMLARHREERPDAAEVAREVDVLRGLTHEWVVVSLAPTRATFDGGAPNAGLVVAPLEAIAELRSEASDVERAITDACVKARVPMASTREAASHVLSGDLRRGGDRVRLRLRLSDAGGRACWAEHFDGSPADPFALEDAAASAVVTAARSAAERRGDLEGDALARLTSARERTESRALPELRAAQADLEALLAEHPRSPSVMAALAEALIRTWGHEGGARTEGLARAEELALRSLDLDPTPEAYAALGGVRSNMGRYAEAWRTLEEAMRRAPTHPAALQRQASILADAGRHGEALARLDLVLRRRPKYTLAHLDRIRVLALLGEAERARVALAEGEAAVGPSAVAAVRARLPVLLADRALAQETADLFARSPVGGAWEAATPFLRAYAASEPLGDDGVRALQRLAGLPHAGVRFRCMLCSIAAEMLAAFGRFDEAMVPIEELDDARTIDVLWFDRCGSIAPLRARERFLEIRAGVAGRAAAVFG